MKAYLDLARKILEEGNVRGDRTGTGTTSLFGYQFRHNLAEGFPLLTTKKLSFKNIAVELGWFLKGDTNIKYLLEHDVHIWTDDAFRMYRKNTNDPDLTKDQFEQWILDGGDFSKEHGDLGPVYGKQWRKWDNYKPSYAGGFAPKQPIDQIKNVIESIKKDPEGRRHIVTAWNPAEIDAMALPPCHCLFQFYVSGGRLSCHLYQRSADYFLGVPYNIASYALLTHIIADQTDLDVSELVISFGDVHIYNNHRDQIAEQLTREPRTLPLLKIVGKSEHRRLEDMNWHDWLIEDYTPAPPIKGDLSVGI